MIRILLMTLLLGGALAWRCPAMAGDYDGRHPLVCSVSQGHEWHTNGMGKAFDPESVGLPRTFVIDFKNNDIGPTGESRVRKHTRIISLDHVEDKLMLQGTDEGLDGVTDGVAWSMSLSTRSGAFVISAAGDRVGYVVFGSCMPK